MRWQNLITRNCSASNCWVYLVWFWWSDWHLKQFKAAFLKWKISRFFYGHIFNGFIVFLLHTNRWNTAGAFSLPGESFSLYLIYFSVFLPSLHHPPRPPPHSHVTPLFVSFTTLFPLHFYLSHALCLSHTNEPTWLACECVCVCLCTMPPSVGLRDFYLIPQYSSVMDEKPTLQSCTYTHTELTCEHQRNSNRYSGDGWRVVAREETWCQVLTL